ncbi:phosphohydrolase [Algiphilus sp.]|uniref:phosphohydrolase n=1 Tax=Algiphilus sp. TaxID=1872431 RepID=UPI002A624059|nr:phosphohydrolase [Pseudomonadota bacterium]
MTTHPENAHSSDQQASGHCGHGCAAHAPEAVRKAAASANGAECDRESLRPREIIHHFPLIDELLEARRVVFGGDDQEPVFQGYRAHAYHILNFGRQWMTAQPERDEKLAIAAVFHDIAAWPNDNLDYLRPSADQADAYLDAIGRSEWKPEMRLMIEMHHKLRPYRKAHAEWVEPVRRADWCDVSFNLLRFGLPKSFIKEVNASFPLGKFYPGHVYKVSAKWMLRHPLNPIPILRW